MADVYDDYDQFEFQRQLQAEGADRQQSLYAPQLREQIAQAQGILISQTDPKGVVDDIIYEFQGFEKDENGDWKKTNEALINPLGVRKIKAILRPLMNSSVRLARLDKRQVKDFTGSVIYPMIYDLGSNWREYEIADRSTCDYIISAITIAVFTMLSRAEDQNEKNWLGRISFENIADPNKNAQKKKSGGFLDNFKF